MFVTNDIYEYIILIFFFHFLLILEYNFGKTLLIL
jgi:hypothetical protein